METLKKFVLFVFILSTAAFGMGRPMPGMREGHFAELFAHPLIIGASVSANWAAESPGLKLTRQYGGKANVYARGGATGVEMTKRFQTAQSFAGYSLILGLDLFFWDSIPKSIFSSHCTDGSAAIRALVKNARVAHVPLVLGTLPNISTRWIPGYQDCRHTLNNVIRAECTSGQGCSVFDLEALYEKLKAEGGLTFQNERYSSRVLIPDGIHPSDIGSRLLADELWRLLL